MCDGAFGHVGQNPIGYTVLATFWPRVDKPKEQRNQPPGKSRAGFAALAFWPWSWFRVSLFAVGCSSVSEPSLEWKWLCNCTAESDLTVNDVEKAWGKRKQAGRHAVGPVAAFPHAPDPCVARCVCWVVRGGVRGRMQRPGPPNGGSACFNLLWRLVFLFCCIDQGRIGYNVLATF